MQCSSVVCEIHICCFLWYGSLPPLQAKDPLNVQPHLKKCFEGIKKLDMSTPNEERKQHVSTGEVHTHLPAGYDRLPELQGLKERQLACCLVYRLPSRLPRGHPRHSCCPFWAISLGTYLVARSLTLHLCALTM